MMKLWWIFLLVPSVSFGELDLQMVLERCTQDSLDSMIARYRNSWAKKCFPKLQEEIEFYSSRTPLRYLLVYSEEKNSWLGPQSSNAACDDWKPRAFCVSSCYPKGEKVWFSKGFIPIEEALENREQFIKTLSNDATLDNLRFTDLEVKSYARSWREDYEDIRIFYMSDGTSLAVTLGHPMLLATGVMVLAKNVHIGESFVNMFGESVEIVDIEDEKYFGRVYNVAPNSGNPIENIVVAEGLLVGSAAYQYEEEMSSLMDRQIMRSLIELPIGEGE